MNGIFPQKQRNKLTKLGVSQQSGLLRNDGRFVRGFFPLPGACCWVVFSRNFAILPPPLPWLNSSARGPLSLAHKSLAKSWVNVWTYPGSKRERKNISQSE